ncbi:TPA: CD1107 family mobile element protein [Streptococcus agalactiae]
MKTKWKKNKKMAITLSGVILLIVALIATMLINSQIVFAQGGLIPIFMNSTEATTESKVEVKVKYIFKDESIYKEEIIKAETGQVLDSGDLPMLEDNMKFIGEFLFYKVKGDGTDEIIRKVEKITVKDKETQTDEEIKEESNEEKFDTDSSKIDKETQTENTTKDNSTQTDITKDDLDKMDREYQELKDKIDRFNKELKDKDKLSDKQKDKIKDLEDEIERLEKKLKKDKEKVNSSKENSELRKSVEDLEKEVKNLQGKLGELNKKKANEITKESISPGNSSEGVLKSITPSAFASTKEQEKLPQNSNIKSSAPSMANTEKKNTEDKEKEVRYPNKLTAKQVPNNNKNSGMSSSGEQINTNKGVASAPSKARASVVENKDNANKDYPIHYNDDKDKKETDKYSADARQFVTFQTKSGKTFHLIINHDEQSENVMLLTEVSEDDLLNMVEKKEKPKEEVKKIEETVPESEVKKEEPKKEEGNGSYIFLGIIVLAVVGAGYYFKIYKKKQEDDDYDEDEEYDEFEDEYEKEDDAEDLEEKEQQTIDDMAIDSYDDEEDEE